MAELEWEWVRPRCGFSFCALVIANYCPCIQKQKEDHENDSPMLPLKILSLPEKTLVREQNSMDRLGSYCSRNRRQYEVHPDYHRCRLRLHLLLDGYSVSASKAVCWGEMACGIELGAELRSVCTRD